MANTNSAEVTALATVGAVLGMGMGFSKLRVKKDTFTWASQPAADTLTLTPVPAGYAILGFGVLTSVSTGSTTLSIGISGTSAKYAALAAYTVVGTYTWLMLTGATDANSALLTASETHIITTAAATAPASGTLKIITLLTQD